MNHDQAYFTDLQIDNFIERGFDIIVRQNNEHTGLCGPRIYYGMTHEVRVWPSVHCIPTGILFLSNPTGTEIAGTPAIFTGTVQISAKYISTGLPDFSPILNAVIGAVGPIITSYFSRYAT